MAPANNRRKCNSGTEAGYVLLVLLLFLSLMVIAAAVVAPAIGVTIQREREEELIHRGVQYSRAVRKFTRKFGHYPVTLDQLQSSNGQRFLRRQYKDPITGKDFKLLHFADVQLSNGPGVAAFSQASQPPGTQFNADGTLAAPSAIGGLATTGQPGPGLADPGAAPLASTPNPGDGGGSTGVQFGSGGASPQIGIPTSAAVTQAGGASSQFGSGTPATQFGGGAILGVVSTSKIKGFHEFDHKSHYNDWKFYFDPGLDRGFPITGPTVRPVISSSGPATEPNADAGNFQQPGVQSTDPNQPHAPQ